MPKYFPKYHTEWKIAQKLYFSEENHQRSSRPAVRVALGGIILGVLVMIIAISVVIGFKQEITQKVAGFGSHIQIVNFDNNSTFELQPIYASDSLLQAVQAIDHVAHVLRQIARFRVLYSKVRIIGIILRKISWKAHCHLLPTRCCFPPNWPGNYNYM